MTAIVIKFPPEPEPPSPRQRVAKICETLRYSMELMEQRLERDEIELMVIWMTETSAALIRKWADGTVRLEPTAEGFEKRPAL